MRFIDLSGHKYGLLTVISRAPNDKKTGRTSWNCLCECGSDTVVTSLNLRSGNSTSCGCQRGRHSKENTYYARDGYMVGVDSNGLEFVFDAEDYDKVKGYCWLVCKGYARAAERGTGKNISLHRLVMGAEKEVDHINRNPADNRKANLREVTRAQNNMNAGLSKNSQSGVTGVHYDKSRDKWVAVIGLDYKSINLGRFKEKEEAIIARKKAEKKYFEEYACV